MVKPGELSDMPECMSDAEDEIRSLRAQLTAKAHEIERLKGELTCYKEGVVESLTNDLTKLIQTVMALKLVAEHVNKIQPESKGFADAVIMACGEALEGFKCSSAS